ncbi:MAG: ATP-binding protein, partial [Candidatus Acidiferrales bacterium]
MIFQQFVALLRALAQNQPLFLVLDDLHWADQASIALLFHLNRALKDTHLLIVGAYRPNDVALGRDGRRHPLEGVLNEIRRYRGDVIVDLNDASEMERHSFVDALLDHESNHLSAQFRAALIAKTGGYPLFTVELLRAMQERGDLLRDAQGHWIESTTLDWNALPARAEGVIAERIERLDSELRDILNVASVEGEAFTVQIIARVREMRERDLLKALSDLLQKQHRLVREDDEVKVGRQWLWHYRFSHVLFQSYLYNELSRGERRLLHGELARILEEIYTGQTDEIALQLAHHYEEAGEDERAAAYRKRAGELAAAAAGNAEAIRHFSRALDLIAEDDWPLRYDLLQERERLYHLQGAREPQLRDIEAMEALAERLDDDRRRAGAA